MIVNFQDNKSQIMGVLRLLRLDARENCTMDLFYLSRLYTWYLSACKLQMTESKDGVGFCDKQGYKMVLSGVIMDSENRLMV